MHSLKEAMYIGAHVSGMGSNYFHLACDTFPGHSICLVSQSETLLSYFGLSFNSEQALNSRAQLLFNIVKKLQCFLFIFIFIFRRV
jgi:hypothetical protein